jgi:hypothetical protein
MKLVTGTLEQMTNLEHQIFIFGAPFRCVWFYNAFWDESTLKVYNNPEFTGVGTDKLQEVNHLGNGVYAIVHIDEMTFAPETFAEYAIQYPEDQNILNRIPEGYEDYTPQVYVSEVVIGDNYTIINV